MNGSPILVLGATGSFGGAMALELAARGRSVRALVRDVDRARAKLGTHRGLEYIAGDVQDRDSVVTAAAGCDTLVHGVNYPYEKWRPFMETATENVIAAATAAGSSVHARRAAGATTAPVDEPRPLVVFPGNVYGLGAQTSKPLDEDAVNSPSTRKGALRIGLEHALQSAVRRRGMRALVLRAGDYFGPTVRNGLVDGIFENALAGKPMRIIGRLGIPHQWAYVPDIARVTADLMAHPETLAPFEVVHFPGYVETQKGFLEIVAEEAGHPGLAARSIPWMLLRLAGLTNRTLRELLELRYLFDRSVILSSRSLPLLLPRFESEPLREAVRETLASYRR